MSTPEANTVAGNRGLAAIRISGFYKRTVRHTILNVGTGEGYRLQRMAT